MALLHPTCLPRPRELTPEVFFDWLCPQLLQVRHRECRRAGGLYRVVLAPRGEWVLDFETLTAGRSGRAGRRADLTLETTYTHWQDLLAGRLDVARAYRGGELVLRGDLARLAMLVELLQPLRGRA